MSKRINTISPFWHRIDPVARRLIGLRTARSLGQGALVVDLALYLKALGWSGLAIGGALAGTGLIAAMLSMLVGIVSDRTQRRGFLVMAEVLTIACAIAAFLSADPWVLVPAIVLAGFGRGANGAASFFGPAEQAWLAGIVRPSERGYVYSLNLAAGATGMAAGAALGVLPEVLAPSMGAGAAFRILFLIPLAGSLVNLASLMGLREPPRAPVHERPALHLRRRSRENHALAWLAGLNGINGFGIGLISPLLSYWFAVRFGIGPAAIAPFMAATFLVSGVASVGTGLLSRRVGVVPAVVSVRLLGVLLLLIVPVAPFYALAAGAYALRSALNRGSVGARQALVVSLVGDQRRGFAVSLNAASFQYAQAAGPALAGALIDVGYLMTPFFLAAVLQTAYVGGYWWAFRNHDPARKKPEEAGRDET